ncbi:MAG: sulfur carrier protein ThiS adenylyltransferase ThiF [Nitrospirota bacterium]
MESLRENLVRKFGQEYLDKVQKARVGFAGAGGLGSNCALNLVRCGFRKLTIVDFDIIIPSNLDRQFYFLDQVGLSKVEALKTNLLRVNPDLEIKALIKKIDKENIKATFADCDIVVECFDRAQDKKMLVEGLVSSGKFIVVASGVGGIGSSDEIKVHMLKENLVLIGDLKSDILDKPPVSPRVNIAAAKQADVVLSYVLHNRV